MTKREARAHGLLYKNKTQRTTYSEHAGFFLRSSGHLSRHKTPGATIAMRDGVGVDAVPS
jgi:hypothetical protein